jgi:hypothetical protein
MLPGIRFLFAAVVFAVSLVIFGLGAAALLRSAHEEFASLPTRRMAPPTVFAQQSVETQPTLSMLRVETPAPEIKSQPSAIIAPAVQESAVSAPSVETDKTAAPESVASLTMSPPVPEAPAPIEPAKPEAAKIEAPESVTTVAVAPSAPAETPAPPAAEVITTTPAPTPLTETPAEPEITGTLTEDDAQLSSSKIAVLGGPPVDTELVPLPVAKPVIIPAKKAAKKPAAKKRRFAAVRPMAAAAPQQTDPFGQPLGR